MIAVPEVTAVTVVVEPEPATTVATAVLLLLQVPPASGSLRLVVSPAQIAVTPAMGDGNGLTVNTVVTIHGPVV
jgi:hypothetical protein